MKILFILLMLSFKTFAIKTSYHPELSESEGQKEVYTCYIKAFFTPTDPEEAKKHMISAEFTGALIASNVVITSANQIHSPETGRSMSTLSTVNVVFSNSGEEYDIEHPSHAQTVTFHRVVIHPDSTISSAPGSADIALIFLEQHVEGIPCLRISTQKPGPGDINCIISGFGSGGDMTGKPHDKPFTPGKLRRSGYVETWVQTADGLASNPLIPKGAFYSNYTITNLDPFHMAPRTRSETDPCPPYACTEAGDAGGPVVSSSSEALVGLCSGHQDLSGVNGLGKEINVRYQIYQVLYPYVDWISRSIAQFHKTAPVTSRSPASHGSCRYCRRGAGAGAGSGAGARRERVFGQPLGHSKAHTSALLTIGGDPYGSAAGGSRGAADHTPSTTPASTGHIVPALSVSSATVPVPGSGSAAGGGGGAAGGSAAGGSGSGSAAGGMAVDDHHAFEVEKALEPLEVPITANDIGKTMADFLESMVVDGVDLKTFVSAPHVNFKALSGEMMGAKKGKGKGKGKRK